MTYLSTENNLNYSADMIYGFLDPQTNIFYAFDSPEEYQCFLDMAAQMNP